jgi:hypothetical protein
VEEGDGSGGWGVYCDLMAPGYGTEDWCMIGWMGALGCFYWMDEFTHVWMGWDDTSWMVFGYRELVCASTATGRG